MQGSSSPNTLVARRQILLKGAEIERTPLLVPSFSSKGIRKVEEALTASHEFIYGAALVSAYDIHYEFIPPKIDFPSLIILDSGGYEASKDRDFSDLNLLPDIPKEWTVGQYESVLNSWPNTQHTVIVSYDHPSHRIPLTQQIEEARTLFGKFPNFVHCLLLKPETSAQTLISVDVVKRCAHLLNGFGLIGFTEKELGRTVHDRMLSLARIRLALSRVQINCPIHVFGSLDPITSALYFLAGADVFDGLTWLRFAYFEGHAIYQHGFGVKKLGVKARDNLVKAKSWSMNVGYLTELEDEMRRFLLEQDFNVFKYNTTELRSASQLLLEAMRGE